MLLLAFMLTASTTVMAQETIRVTGKVTNKDDNSPLMSVNVIDITDKKHRYKRAETDEDGRFAFDIAPNATLEFSMVGANKVVVKLKGQDSLSVQLILEDNPLDEVTVIAKKIDNRPKMENRPMKVRGNTIYYNTVVRLPKKIFGNQSRMVFNVYLENLTRNEIMSMKPLVFDASEYNITQQRQYGFDMDGIDGDPLGKFITIKNDTTLDKKTKNFIFEYSDSIRMANPHDEKIIIAEEAVENYHKVYYRDTMQVSDGTVDPLRWLEYKLVSTEVTDSAYFPKKDLPQPKSSEGSIDLRFPVGQAVFSDDEHNLAEIEKLKAQILAVSETPNATINSLTIKGTASPDGRYAPNFDLAKRRLDYAVDYMREQIPERLRKGMQFKSEPRVASWGEVIELMRKDSLMSEAAQIEAITKRYKRDDCTKPIRQLSFYNDLLEGKYLPMLRSVGYEMKYTVLRNLTLKEIQESYKSKPLSLTNYEYFKLYRSEKNDTLREEILRNALKASPKFMLAANDLQVILISKQKSDPNLLKPFIGKKKTKTKLGTPTEVYLNHVVALLSNCQYEAADTISFYYLPDTEATRTVKALNDVYNGRYDRGYDIVAKMSDRNKVAVLLAMDNKDRNEEAYEVVKTMPDSVALTHYFKAICLNRLGDAINAYEELKKAFKIDPSYEKIARTDGDVNKLLPEEKKEDDN